MESSGGPGVKVIIADDHAVVRSGLRLLLDKEPDLEVVAEAGDVVGALRYVRVHRPDVLVLDLNMPGDPSLPAIPRVAEESPETRVVVLTMQNDPAFAREALQAGAAGYVLKEAASTELVEAVRLVHASRARQVRDRAPAARGRRDLGPARRDGEPGHHTRAGVRGVDRQRAGGEHDPFPHAAEPESFRRRSDREARAVVGHLDDQLRSLELDHDVDPLGAGVLGHVGKRFLDEPVGGRLDLRAYPSSSSAAGRSSVIRVRSASFSLPIGDLPAPSLRASAPGRFASSTRAR
jgi:CheY-like chemotaxis protein